MSISPQPGPSRHPAILTRPGGWHVAADAWRRSAAAILRDVELTRAIAAIDCLEADAYLARHIRTMPALADRLDEVLLLGSAVNPAAPHASPANQPAARRRGPKRTSRSAPRSAVTAAAAAPPRPPSLAALDPAYEAFIEPVGWTNLCREDPKTPMGLAARLEAGHEHHPRDDRPGGRMSIPTTTNGTRPAATANGVAPPHSLEAEQSVLGGILLSDRAMYGLVIEEGLKAGDFYRDRHRLIYDAMCRLHGSGEPVDVLTVADHLERDGRLADAGGRAGDRRAHRRRPRASAPSAATPRSSPTPPAPGTAQRHLRDPGADRSTRRHDGPQLLADAEQTIFRSRPDRPARPVDTLARGIARSRARAPRARGQLRR